MRGSWGASKNRWTFQCGRSRRKWRRRLYTVEETIDHPVPEVVNSISQDQVQNRTVDQIVAVSVSQGQEEIVEVIRLVSQIPRERVSKYIEEQIVHLPVPEVGEPSVEVVKASPQ